MLLIYVTLISILFLINGLLLMSSYSYYYYNLTSHLTINNITFEYLCYNYILY